MGNSPIASGGMEDNDHPTNQTTPLSTIVSIFLILRGWSVLAIARERFGVRQAQSRELRSLTRIGAHRPLRAEQAVQWLGSILSRTEASVDPNSWAFSYHVRAKSTLAT
jgi:hypothetical protein